MYRKYLEHIADVSIYPIVSLLIFFLFFAALSTYLLKSDKKHMDFLSRIPLNNSAPENE